jgi:hypothetical protein
MHFVLQDRQFFFARDGRDGATLTMLSYAHGSCVQQFFIDVVCAIRKDSSEFPDDRTARRGEANG